MSCHLVAWPRLRIGIATAGRLGFSAVEAFADALMVNDPGDVAARLADAGVTLSGAYLDLPAEPRAAGEASRRASAAAAALGARRLIVTVPPSGADPIAVCAAAAQPAADTGVRLCLHPHQGSGVETAAQTARVLDGTDPDQVWVCPDTGHLLAAGDDPTAALGAWAPRIAALHVKDLDRHGQVVPIGTGRLDLSAVLGAARRAGALEHLTLEFEGDDPDEALSKSRAALERGIGR